MNRDVVCREIYSPTRKFFFQLYYIRVHKLYSTYVYVIVYVYVFMYIYYVDTCCASFIIIIISNGCNLISPRSTRSDYNNKFKKCVGIYYIYGPRTCTMRFPIICTYIKYQNGCKKLFYFRK